MRRTAKMCARNQCLEKVAVYAADQWYGMHNPTSLRHKLNTKSQTRFPLVSLETASTRKEPSDKEKVPGRVQGGFFKLHFLILAETKIQKGTLRHANETKTNQGQQPNTPYIIKG